MPNTFSVSMPKDVEQRLRSAAWKLGLSLSAYLRLAGIEKAKAARLW